MLLSHRRDIATDAGRFLITGAVNTGLSFVVYQAALFVMPASFAYALSWIVGIVFIAAFYPSRVFPGGRRGAIDRLLLVVSYVGVFLAGLSLLHELVASSVQPRLAIVAVLALTTTLNFVFARLLLRRSAQWPK